MHLESIQNSFSNKATLVSFFLRKVIGQNYERKDVRPRKPTLFWDN
jgi:hypothetical protein